MLTWLITIYLLVWAYVTTMLIVAEYRDTRDFGMPLAILGFFMFAGLLWPFWAPYFATKMAKDGYEDE